MFKHAVIKNLSLQTWLFRMTDGEKKRWMFRCAARRLVSSAKHAVVWVLLSLLSIKANFEIVKEHNDPESSRSHCILLFTIFLLSEVKLFLSCLPFIQGKGVRNFHFRAGARCDFCLCGAEN